MVPSFKGWVELGHPCPNKKKRIGLIDSKKP
jgi:hypothetical protein